MNDSDIVRHVLGDIWGDGSWVDTFWCSHQRHSVSVHVSWRDEVVRLGMSWLRRLVVRMILGCGRCVRVWGTLSLWSLLRVPLIGL